MIAEKRVQKIGGALGRTGDLKVVPLLSRGLKIRKMTIDAQGRLWYMGSANGRLGMVE
jgi:virginiamycin B lyase